MSEEELRPFTWGTDGRLDNDGTVWYACDPYPTWFRWEDGKLILPRFKSYYEDGDFPGWKDENGNDEL